MKIAAALAISMGLAAAQSSQQGEEVRKAQAGWVSAIRAGDAAALDRLLADDLVYTHATGPVDTKKAYIASITSRNQKYDSIEHDNMNLRLFGDTAVIHSNTRMTGSTKGVPFDNRLRLIQVWVKQKGSWRLVAHQTTRIP